MSDRLKIFLGADDRGADSEELKILGNESEGEGYIRYRTTKRMMASLSENDQISAVTIRGGWADVCVPEAVDYFLRRGVRSVVCELPRIRASCPEHNVSNEKRKEQIFRWMLGDKDKVIFIE